MDRLNYKQLLRSKVQTKNEEVVGVVVDFELDTLQLRVQSILVKPQGLFQPKLSIGADHIIEIKPGLVIIDEYKKPVKGSPLESTNVVLKGSDSAAAFNSDN